jgi:hypothetical protein
VRRREADLETLGKLLEAEQETEPTEENGEGQRDEE